MHAAPGARALHSKLYDRTPVYGVWGRFRKTGIRELLSGSGVNRRPKILSGLGTDPRKIPNFCPDSVSTPRKSRKIVKNRKRSVQLCKSAQINLNIHSVLLLNFLDISPLLCTVVSVATIWITAAFSRCSPTKTAAVFFVTSAARWSHFMLSPSLKRKRTAPDGWVKVDTPRYGGTNFWYLWSV